MKVIAIVALVSMIAGISGDPVGPEPNRARNEELRRMHELQRFVYQTDFHVVYLKLRHTEIQETTVDGKIKWKINTGTDVDSAAVEIVETFLNSMMVLGNETELQFQRASNAPQGGLNSTIETACHWFTTMNSIMGNLTHDLKPWWTPEQRTSADLARNILSAVLQYTCQNKGSHVSDFFAADGDVCLDSSATEINSCSVTSYGNTTSFKKDPDYSRPINLLWDDKIITPNNQFCRDFETFQTCTVEVFKRCQNQTPSHEINNLFNIVKQSSGCDDLLNAQIPILTNN